VVQPIRSSRLSSAFVVGGMLVVGALSTGVSAAFTVTTTPIGHGVSSGSLAAPTGLTAGCVALTNKVTLNWTATTSLLAQGYSILRATTTGGPYSPIASVSGHNTTTYTDTIATLATQYYVIKATRNNWTSPNSNQAGVQSIALGVCNSV
jgi:hypothetical protein